MARMQISIALITRAGLCHFVHVVARCSCPYCSHNLIVILRMSDRIDAASISTSLAQAFHHSDYTNPFDESFDRSL